MTMLVNLKSISLNNIRNDIILWSGTIFIMAISHSTFFNRAHDVFNIKNNSARIKINTANNKDTENLRRHTQTNSLFSVDGLQTYEASTSKNIIATFANINYDYSAVTVSNNYVPNIQPNRIPLDLKSILPTKKRKKLFLSMLLPLALKINSNIKNKRQSLLELSASFKNNNKLSTSQFLFLKHLSLEYGVKSSEEITKKLHTLKMRVDELPVDLILAQGAIESGWGTSRFSIKGNALFGQWTYKKNQGIIPLGRDKGKTHSIKIFSSPYQSMKAYMSNLNKNPAYSKLRLLRANLRKSGTAVTGIALSESLNKYSEERGVYTKKLRIIIQSNKLEALNSLKLNVNKFYLKVK